MIHNKCIFPLDSFRQLCHLRTKENRLSCQLELALLQILVVVLADLDKLELLKSVGKLFNLDLSN